MVDRDLTGELGWRAIHRVLAWHAWYRLNLSLPMLRSRLRKAPIFIAYISSTVDRRRKTDLPFLGEGASDYNV